MSCGSDDDACPPEMLTGTYVGSLICDDASNNDDDILLSVRASGDGVVIVDEEGEEYQVNLNGCNFNIPEVTLDFFGIEIKVSGNGEFSGDNLNFTVSTSAQGVTEDCRFVAVKQ